MADRKGYLWLLILLVHLIVAAIGFHLHTNRTVDSAEYLYQAKNIRTHLSFYCGEFDQVHKPEWYSLRPPGYGAFLSILTAGGISLWLVIIAQIALSMFSIFLAYRSACLVFKKEIPLGFFILPLTAFLPQFIYGGMIMSEILFQTCITGMVFCGLMFHHTERFKWILYFQLLITLAMLVKPVAWLFPVVAFPLALWMVMKKGYSGKLLVTFIFPFVVIALIFFRNYSYTGVAEYSSVSRKLLINYNVAALLTEQKGQVAAFHEIDSLQAVVSELNYPDRCIVIDRFVKAKISDAPLLYAKVHMKGLLRFFLDTGRWEWRRYFALDSPGWKSMDDVNVESYLRQWSVAAILYQLYCLLFNLALIVCIIILALTRWIDYRDRRLIIGVVLYIAIITGPSASARFRIPVFPLQLIAWGVLANRVRKSESSLKPNFVV